LRLQASLTQPVEPEEGGTVYEVRTTDSFFNDFDRQNMG
jgi:hypothetical protein